MPKRALLSVSDKTGITSIAKRLNRLGYEIISTGGTKKELKAAGIAVTAVEDVTHFPECFSGRVKTIHPMILGGVLFRRGDAKQEKEASTLKIEPIDLVIVNLYPFEETAKKSGVSPEELIEQIDIGGPTLLRSAAKNHESVTVICDPRDYERVLAQIEEKGETTPELRAELAAKVFLRVAAYDAAIAETLTGGKNTSVLLTGKKELRYGENPHQWGKYYEFPAQEGDWEILGQGKEPSYLNILDADGAWSAVCGFSDPTAVFVKHANPSGIASNGSILDAFQRAYDADRLSAFGVIIALNRPCTEAIAQRIVDQKIFTEVIIAPEYEDAALSLFREKSKVRVIRCHWKPTKETVMYRSALGGVLTQNMDTLEVTEKDLTCVTKKKPTPEEVTDLLFAWKCVKYAKSNAIVFAKDRVTIGIGSGQTNRVDATWIAAKRAGERAKGAVMASDAFFPFPDAVEEAAKNGIAAIVQPGGSIRDEEIFARANELGLSMVITGKRAFLH